MGSDDLNLDSSNLQLGQDLETELFTSDREETEETDEVFINDGEVADNRQDDASFSDRDDNCSVDQCTAGPTMHWYQSCENSLEQHKDESDRDEDEIETGEEVIDHEDDVSDGSDLGYIALCENYLHELRHGTIERHIHGYLKNREKLASGRWDDIVNCYGKYPLNAQLMKILVFLK